MKHVPIIFAVITGQNDVGTVSLTGVLARKLTYLRNSTCVGTQSQTSVQRFRLKQRLIFSSNFASSTKMQKSCIIIQLARINCVHQLFLSMFVCTQKLNILQIMWSFAICMIH